MKSLKTLLLIATRSLRQHALSTLVTACSTALAAGLVMSVFTLSDRARDSFTADPGFDAVMGARGSQLQLVLNSVFHLETSPGNLPWTVYEAIAARPEVVLAVPYAVGDSYRSFRVVGTTPELFTDFPGEESQGLPLQRGRLFGELAAEAVLGAAVAANTGLDLNDKFKPTHGVVAGGGVHDREYNVVGVLAPTGTAMDRVVWIPIEGIFRMDGHVLRGNGELYTPTSGQAISAEHKEVSAVMLKTRSPRSAKLLAQEVNGQGTVGTIAFPIAGVMAEIFEKLGWMVGVLRVVAYLTVIVAAGSILASLYNTMNERRREFAILRALGARRATLVGAILLESSLIAGLGALLGVVVYAVTFAVAAEVVRSRTGVILEFLPLHPAVYWTPVAIVVLGAASGLLPALRAYRSEVAKNLLPVS